jgi:hypothetical protein
MEGAYTISGAGFHIKKYRTDDGGSGFPLAAGIPVVADEGTAASQGVLMGTTTASTLSMGISLDAPDASTGAQVGATAGYLSNGDNATYVSTIINPDLVIRAKLNDGATEDTALALATQATPDATGLDVSSCDISVPDNSTVWGYSGANAGVIRQTSAADTFVVAMPYDIAAGDTFLFTEHIIGWTQATPTLTTLLTQVDANTAGTTQKNYVVVEFEARDVSADGRNNSFMLMVAHDHVFGGNVRLA